jgi:hypothetical protein
VLLSTFLISAWTEDHAEFRPCFFNRRVPPDQASFATRGKEAFSIVMLHPVIIIALLNALAFIDCFEGRLFDEELLLTLKLSRVD